MKNKKQRKVMLLLLILLGITIGFALLSVTLKINGTAGIKSSRWDIHWENVQPNNESTITADEPEIDTNKTKVSYEVELSLPGDYYEFTVDAKNDGSINGEITKVDHNVYQVVNGVAETEATTLPSYIKYSIVYDGTEDGPQEGDILEAGEVQTYRIRIEYDSNSSTLPETDVTYKIEDEITYTQTKESKSVTGFLAPKPDNGPTLGGLEFGDEICIGDSTTGKECFNVLTSDDNTTKMLAKYNLLVGNTCTDRDTCTVIPTSTEGYGKQSSTALATGDGSASNSSEYPAVGIVAFSANNYWFENVGSNSKYIGEVSSSNSGVWENYSSPYPNVYDENSTAYNYFNVYLNYLKSMGANSNTKIELFDTNFANSLFNFVGSGTCWDDTENYVLTDKGKFILNTSFWLGNAASGYSNNDLSIGEVAYGSMWAISRYDSEYGGNPSVFSITDNKFGLRPVIEVPTSSIVFDGWRFVNPGSTGTNQKYEYWTKGKKIEEGLIPNLLDYSNNLRTYYFKNGLVQYGWQKVNDKVYYFSESDTDGNGYTDGNMVFGGTVNIGGTDYEFASSGECISNNCPSL